MPERSASMDSDDQHMEDGFLNNCAGGEKERAPEALRLSYKKTPSVGKFRALGPRGPSKPPDSPGGSETPEVLEVKPKRKRKGPTIPVIRQNGTLIHTRFSRPLDLDRNYAKETWYSKVKKIDMLYMLVYAGYDTSIIKEWNLTRLCQYMVAVAKDRKDERENGNTRKVHAAAVLASEATYKEALMNQATKSEDADEHLHGAYHEEGHANFIADDALDIDAEGDSDDENAAPGDLWPYVQPTLIDEHEEDVDVDGPTLVDNEVPAPVINKQAPSNAPTIAAPLRKAPAKTRFRRTMSTNTARSHILAIEQEARNDFHASSFLTYENYLMYHIFIPASKTTLAQDADGNIMFSTPTQMLMRDVIQNRDTARLWGDRTQLVQGGEGTTLEAVRRGHGILCGQVVAVLTDWLEDGDPDEAGKLVEECFGI